MGIIVLPPIVERDAVLSDDGVYRYSLRRVFATGRGRVVFCMLNPSTADARVDDPTIRRCLGFAAAWGIRELVVVNLFAFRATLPPDMMAAAEPIGPLNDFHLLQACTGAERVVCAWGQDGRFRHRDRAVVAMLKEQGVALEALRLAKNGAPWHPLYLPADTQPLPFAG